MVEMRGKIQGKDEGKDVKRDKANGRESAEMI